MESAIFYIEVKKKLCKKKVYLPTYPNYFGDVIGNKTFPFFGLKKFVLYMAKISGERLQDHWSSSRVFTVKLVGSKHLGTSTSFL